MGLEERKTIIVKCVEKIMVNILGAGGKDAILYHLSIRGVNIEDAAEHPDEFMVALYEIFSSGAQIFERGFAREITHTLGLNASTWTLHEAVKAETKTCEEQ